MSEALFSTLLYSKPLEANSAANQKVRRQLQAEIEDVAQLDVAGQVWSASNYRHGFTSYASVNKLHHFSTTFARLEKKIDIHVKKFSRELGFDLQGGKLRMDTCWVNIMPPNAIHTAHVHPLSVISGTFYVSVPKGSSVIKFEDPRLGLFMNRPPLKETAKEKLRPFRELNPAEGSVVLFESWLRHEVPMNTTARPRISVSFNYGWE